MTQPFSIVPLDPRYDRRAFVCGIEPLDRYFREQVSQDQKRRATACFVAVDEATGKVAGYYTLAAAGVPLGDLPESLAKRLPRYPSVPVARLGRLAVDVNYQGQKMGSALLWDAVTRALRSEVAVAAVVVDAKDDSVAAFYRHFGVLTLEGEGRRLVLPLGHIRV